MDAEFTKWLVTLGVGGILAGLMFMFYRKDIKQFTELWKMTTDQVMGIIRENMDIIKENTASNTKLVTILESIERNALRREDIISLVDKRVHDMNLPPQRVATEDRTRR